MFPKRKIDRGQMPDFVKKIKKARSEDLQAGEVLEAATIGQPSGTFTRQAMGGLLGVLAAKKVADKRQDLAYRREAFKWLDDQGLVFVGNISRYSSGLRICRDARFDDGNAVFVPRKYSFSR